MTNSVDPGQTAPSEAVWSGSVLFAYAILLDTLIFEILGHLHPTLNTKRQHLIILHFSGSDSPFKPSPKNIRQHHSFNVF